MWGGWREVRLGGWAAAALQVLPVGGVNEALAGGTDESREVAVLSVSSV
jgi:hypothetical protein